MDQLERRQVLLAAATGATLLSTAANAQPRTPPTITPPPAKITAAAIAAAKAPASTTEIAQWNSLKGRLKEYGNWPATFDVPFEAGVKEQLKLVAAQEQNKLTHNPRLVEPLLGDISTLVDRCLTYRNQGSQLEIQGVAASLNRIIADSTREVDQNIIKTNPSPDVAAVLAANYPAAAKHFQGSNSEIGAGTAIQVQAEGVSNAKLHDISITRIQLSLAPLQFTQDINRQLLGRYNVPGNAHNYSQRFDRIRKLFESDIVSAYQRAMAAAVGLSKLFDYSDPLPSPNGSDFLDDFVIWTRKAMRAVNQIGESEIEIVRYIRIDAVPVGAFDHDFTDVFAGMKYVRLRDLSVSFCGADADVTTTVPRANASFPVVMVLDGAQLGPRPVIALPGVNAFGAQRQTQTVSGGAVYNIDPRGNWSIRMSATGVTTNNTAISRDTWVTGLVIQLHVVCVPDPALDGSWWVSGDRL
jgi:hypothetical protein